MAENETTATESIRVDLGEITVTVEIDGDPEGVSRLYNMMEEFLVVGASHAVTMKMTERMTGEQYPRTFERDE